MDVLIDEVLKQKNPITISYNYLLQLARKGRFISAKKLGKLWVIDEREARGEKLTEKDLEPCNLVVPEEYAKLHNCKYTSVIRRLHSGCFKTAIRYKQIWLLDKDDVFLNQTEYIHFLENKKLMETLSANRKN